MHMLSGPVNPECLFTYNFTRKYWIRKTIFKFQALFFLCQMAKHKEGEWILRKLIRNSTKLFDNFLGYYIYKKWIRNAFQIHFSAVISWNDFSPQVRTEKFTLKFISSWSCQLSSIAGPLLWSSAFSACPMICMHGILMYVEYV